MINGNEYVPQLSTIKNTFKYNKEYRRYYNDFKHKTLIKRNIPTSEKDKFDLLENLESTIIKNYGKCRYINLFNKDNNFNKYRILIGRFLAKPEYYKSNNEETEYLSSVFQKLYWRRYLFNNSLILLPISVMVYFSKNAGALKYFLALSSSLSLFYIPGMSGPMVIYSNAYFFGYLILSDPRDTKIKRDFKQFLDDQCLVYVIDNQ